MRRSFAVLYAASALCLPASVHAQVVTSAAGPNAAAIQASVDSFRTSLGTLNPNVVGSFGSGRREINWDGVPDGFSSPNAFPAGFFNGNVAGRARGAQFSTPGSGFQVSSSAASGVPVEFGNIDPTYSDVFATFSPQRLFAAIGSNVVDVTFFIPGSAAPALVRGFGSVFTDVELAGATSLQLFDIGGASLGTFFATPVEPSSGSLSFLGVSYATANIARVRITNGNAALGAGVLDGGGADLVVMDDFIYGEPNAVPEPATWALMIGGFGLIGWRARRRTAKRRPCPTLPMS